jgi:hypothetical protein
MFSTAGEVKRHLLANNRPVSSNAASHCKRKESYYASRKQIYDVQHDR